MANNPSAGCWRCNGTGVYRWGAVVNGKSTHEGPCFRCVGGGQYAPAHVFKPKTAPVRTGRT
jgi:hypothetical protein